MLDIHTLKNVVQDVAQGVVASVGYVHGHAYEVEVVGVTDDRGGHLVFGIDGPGLMESRADRPYSAETVVLLSLEFPWLRRALGELRRAMREPADTGFHCYRAVEAVRQHFRLVDDRDASESWIRMRRT
jgi:hypothetical protein